MRRNSIWAGIVVALLVSGCGQNVSEQVQIAKQGIKKLDKAVQEYSAKWGTFPPSLTALVAEGLVRESDLSDPWDREYRYDPNGKRNRGRKPDIWTATPDQTRTVSN